MDTTEKAEIHRIDTYVTTALQGLLVNRKPNMSDEILYNYAYKIATEMKALVDSNTSAALGQLPVNNQLTKGA